ncbi:F-box/kelch-repeat protein At3g23880-like [Solanum stenotomum]|uniref:F-box/kelch-repeat protein At3g23880-like n=1 Tax=Solanum stenotomum TaxID=172797 RepID=UPI0020D1AA6E|nr:F-box/kelch-repeat protein At3g23880-like [Solanum stenotomum]
MMRWALTKSGLEIKRSQNLETHLNFTSDFTSSLTRISLISSVGGIGNSKLKGVFELVVEILLKLPIKSLLKFKCVSKSWLALISSSEFVKTHLRLNANNKEYTHHKVMMRCISNYGFKSCSLTSLFNESRVTEAKDLDYPTKSYGLERDRYDVFIVGSVNGLICLVNDDKELLLWNPSIRKYKKLPYPKTSLPLQGDPRRAYGFGYDEVHEDYKVVIFNEIETNMIREFEVKMYSLKSDSLRVGVLGSDLSVLCNCNMLLVDV